MIHSIVALDQKRGMAKHGFQPWSIPDDEKYFTDQTKLYGGVCLIGSTTYKTFHGPLVERQNFVVTRDTTPIPGVFVVNDMDKFFAEHQGQDIWVIGGASIFEQTMAIADELYITKIEADFACDQFFPEYENAFELAQESDLHEQNGFVYTYKVYKKR
jgi:dihydrofolate reductase